MRTPLLAGLVAFTVYAVSPVKVQSDSIWSIPTAVSLLDEGNADLDEYRATTIERPFGIIEARGHVYSVFPVGPSLAAVPFLFVFDLGVKGVAATGLLPAATERWRTHFHATGAVDLVFYDTIELILASLFTAGAVVFVFLTGRRFVSTRSALFGAAIFAFGTGAYSTASRVLWQHAPSMLTIAAIVFVLTGPARRPVLLGVLAGLAFLFRPTNALTVIACAAFLRPRQLGWYALGAAVVALPFCVHNWNAYGALLPAYYLPSRLDPADSHFFEALAGNLISPNRGLFVFTPVLLGGFLARPRGAEWLFVAVLAAHWVVVSLFPHWWAGHSYGPRLFTDVLPYAVFFLFRPLEEQRRRAFLGTTAALSVFIHARGAIAHSTHGWNDGPPDVDAAPQRVWDFRDPQILR